MFEPFRALFRYFETEITQDAHILNADIERLEKEKIRLTILIRKLDARLKSLVTQASPRILLLITELWFQRHAPPLSEVLTRAHRTQRA